MEHAYNNILFTIYAKLAYKQYFIHNTQLFYYVRNIYIIGPVPVNDIQTPPSPLKSGRFILSQKMHAVLERIQKQFSIFFFV